MSQPVDLAELESTVNELGMEALLVTVNIAAPKPPLTAPGASLHDDTDRMIRETGRAPTLRV